MTQVTLTIGGKTHRVSCANGEEAHITRLGAMIDDRLKTMGDNLSAQEAENILFAALLLADELVDAQKELKAKQQAIVSETDRRAQETALATKLDGFADLLENCADKLEAGVPAT